jgi:O-antigen/teichoic acid export membrane protein
LAQSVAAVVGRDTRGQREPGRKPRCCLTGADSIVRRLQGLFLSSATDLQDSDKRAAERHRRALLTGIASATARVVQIGTSLITVPLTLRYLGNERFGLWMTISSVLAMASFADFGVGNGVLNTVATAYGKDDVDGIRKAVSSGFALLNTIAGVLLLAFFSIYRLVNWADFFRVVSPQARAEAGPALAVFAVCFALNISMDVVQRVQLGLQQGYRYGVWQFLGSLTGFVGVLCGIWLHVSLPVLVIAIAGAPIFATALNAIHFFGFVRPDLRPSAAFVSQNVAAQIARLGGLFFVLQLAASISYSSDNIVLTRIMGPLAVAQYAVPCRLFNLVTMATSFVLIPLWPAYGEALEKKDYLWIRETLYRSLLIVTGVSAFLSAALVIFGNKIIHLWVGASIHASPTLLVALGIWGVVLGISSTIAVCLNGLSVVRFQVILAIVGSLINIALSIYLTRRIGIPGVIYGSILTQVFIGFFPYYWFMSRYFKRNLLEASSAYGRSR